MSAGTATGADDNERSAAERLQELLVQACEIAQQLDVASSLTNGGVLRIPREAKLPRDRVIRAPFTVLPNAAQDEKAARRQAHADHFAAMDHLARLINEHPDRLVRTAARGVLCAVEHPCLKLTEDAKDLLDCRVNDLGVVVQVGAVDHQVEAAEQYAGSGRVVADVAGREFLHQILPLLHGLRTRYVALGVLLAAGVWLQRRAGLRRAAEWRRRPSGAQVGGAR